MVTQVTQASPVVTQVTQASPGRPPGAPLTPSPPLVSHLVRMSSQKQPQKQPLDVATHLSNLEALRMPVRPTHGGAIKDVTAPTVYILGDLEGQLHLLHNLLVELKLIRRLPGADPRCPSPAFEWIAGEDVYVVQCGDQIDASRVARGDRTNFDLETLLFTDYLGEISGGRFLSVIGNHEWLNVHGDQRYVSKADKALMTPEERTKAFGYDGLIGKILRRRHIMLRINNALFTHAGACAEIFKDKFGDDIDTVIKKVNDLVDDPNNYDKDTMSPEFRYYAVPPETDDDDDKDNHTLLWTRRLHPTELQKIDSKIPLVPPQIADTIDVMVTGHNKVKYMHVVTARKSAANVTIAMCPEGYEGVSSNMKCVVTDESLPTIYESDIDFKAAKTLIATDTLLRQIKDDDDLFTSKDLGVRMQYVILTAKEHKFGHMAFQKFACGPGGTCELIQPSLFLAACSKLLKKV